MENLTEQLLHENEIKTNATAMRALIVMAVGTSIAVTMQIIATVTFGAEWTVLLIMVCTAVVFLMCAFIKKSNYDKPVIKYLILISVTVYSGITCFLFPLVATFIMYGPVLISIRYYDEKLTLKTAITAWFVYILTLVLNLILERTSYVVGALHLSQNMNIWQYPKSVILYYGITRSLIMGIATVLALRIVKNGKMMIIEQADMFRKTSSLESELYAAARIQSRTMASPDYVAANKRIRLHAGIDSARDVGGDFYDRFKVDDNVLCLVVADVSDKGIPAAMFSMRAQSAIRFIIKDMASRGEIDLAVAADKINQLLIHNNKDDMFVTAWIGWIDSRTGVCRYVNAGHMPPYIRHKDGSIEKIEGEPQLFFGMFKHAEYKSAIYKINDGDRLILYTDGITDARNIFDETFGSEGLENALRTADPEIYDDPKAVYKYLAGTVDKFTEGTKQFDDETIMVVDYDGSPDVNTGSIGEIRDSSAVIDKINELLISRNCPEEVRRNIDVIIDETCSNVLDYGIEDVQSKAIFIIDYEIGDNYLYLVFKDNGTKFDPTEVSDPDISDEPRIGGLGIYLVRNLSDEFSYQYAGGYNVLTVKKVWGI